MKPLPNLSRTRLRDRLAGTAFFLLALCWTPGELVLFGVGGAVWHVAGCWGQLRKEWTRA